MLHWSSGVSTVLQKVPMSSRAFILVAWQCLTKIANLWLSIGVHLLLNLFTARQVAKQWGWHDVGTSRCKVTSCLELKTNFSDRAMLVLAATGPPQPPKVVRNKTCAATALCWLRCNEVVPVNSATLWPPFKVSKTKLFAHRRRVCW